jgi:outer membrane lipopolysaccharide assembly protein LptE/RlpB
MRRAIGLIVLAFGLAGCGYALVGTGSFLPPDLDTLYIPTFENKTTRVELEQIVTRAVTEEFVSRGRLRLVNAPPDADTLLRGTITGFGLTPVAFDAQGRATQYQVNVRAKIELVDRRGEEEVPIWKNDQYYFSEDYSVNPEEFDSFDQETRAIRDIAVRFAESLVSSILEGF